MRYCIYCGAKHNIGDAFCMSCGKPIFDIDQFVKDLESGSNNNNQVNQQIESQQQLAIKEVLNEETNVNETPVEEVIETKEKVEEPVEEEIPAKEEPTEVEEETPEIEETPSEEPKEVIEEEVVEEVHNEVSETPIEEAPVEEIKEEPVVLESQQVKKEEPVKEEVKEEIVEDTPIEESEDDVFDRDIKGEEDKEKTKVATPKKDTKFITTILLLIGAFTFFALLFFEAKMELPGILGTACALVSLINFILCLIKKRKHNSGYDKLYYNSIAILSIAILIAAITFGIVSSI